MKKGALITSITMVMVTIFALTAVSFAWFTSSLNPLVSDFDLKVTTADSLLVSAKPDKDFKTTLPISDLTATDVIYGQDRLQGNIIPTFTDKWSFLLDAATPAGLESENASQTLADAVKPTTDTADENVWMDFMKVKNNVSYEGAYGTEDTGVSPDVKIADYVKVLRSSYITDDGTINESTDKYGHFVKFDLYFKSTVVGEDTLDVNLKVTPDKDKDSTYTGYTGTKVYMDTAGTDTDLVDEYYQSEIAKIVRVAFLTRDYGKTVSANTDVELVVYEPDAFGNTEMNVMDNSDPRGDYKTTAQNNFYSIAREISATAADTATGSKADFEKKWKANDANNSTNHSDWWNSPELAEELGEDLSEKGKNAMRQDYYKYIDNPTVAETSTGTSMVFENFMKSDTVMNDSKVTGLKDIKLFSIDRSTTKRTTVYLWLEGNDAECNALASAVLFKTLLAFSGSTTPAP